jgi:hypothetical protein
MTTAESEADWGAAAARYADRLRGALAMARGAIALAGHPRAEAPMSAVARLRALAEPLERQLHRLEEGEFRVAVVGLEKAGKSTFLNAWLGRDLLPNDSARCTFAPTKIVAVEDPAEQRLEIDPLSPEEFRSRRADLETAAAQGSEEGLRARADLEAMDRHAESLRAVVERGPQSIPFRALDEIASPLRASAADARQAHAIKEVRLFTSELGKTGGLAFHDLPGLNSGLAKHVEESRGLLADCDAVILVQRSSTPSIEASEQRLIAFMREGDRTVGLGSKLFVFLGRIDQEGSERSLADNRAIAARDWHARCRLAPDRIIPGSAAAHLTLLGVAGDGLAKNAGSADKLLANLRHATGTVDDRESLLEAAGIGAIQARVERFLRHERVELLMRRCDGPIDEIAEAAAGLLARVRERFPEDAELARRQFEEERLIQFSRWWGPAWERIQAEVNRHYEREVIRRAPDLGAQPQALVELRQRYEAAIVEGLDRLPALGEGRRDTIFDTGPVFDSTRANLDWRRELHREIAALLDDVARALALELEDEAAAFLGRMTDLLWGATRVRRELARSMDGVRQTLEHGLRALFLRFARPVAEALIRGPHGSETRAGIVARLGPDIDLLDHSYEGDDPAYRSLRKYLTQPRRPAESANGARDPEAPARPASGRRGSSNRAEQSADASAQQSPAERRDDLVREVRDDLSALREYLLRAVFPAAGFAPFCEQELGRLRDRFLELEGTWRGVAQNEWLQGNPNLLRELPPELRDETFPTDLYELLHDLKAIVRSHDAA